MTIIHVLDKLRSIYQHISRKYHDLNHIKNMLELLVECSFLTKKFSLLSIVIWFHDAVYDATRKDNEIKSAEMFRDLMSPYLDQASLDWGYKAICATADHLPNDDPDIQLLLDLDLASIASPYEIFDQNSVGIRKEYEHVSDEDFHKGRKAFFKKLLEREHIFGTKYWRDRLEAKAVENIQRYLNA